MKQMVAASSAWGSSSTPEPKPNIYRRLWWQVTTSQN